MQYISSDTNIWIDFQTIGRLEMPFRLNYTFLMSSDVMARELLSPKDLPQKLLAAGLQKTDITDEEYWLAMGFRSKYHKLSDADAVALAIAKTRFIMLLSGDGGLRRAAITEGVTVHGTLWIFDQLLDSELISSEEYRQSMVDLKLNQGGSIRLPVREIEERIRRVSAD